MLSAEVMHHTLSYMLAVALKGRLLPESDTLVGLCVLFATFAEHLCKIKQITIKQSGS